MRFCKLHQAGDEGCERSWTCIMCTCNWGKCPRRGVYSFLTINAAMRSRKRHEPYRPPHRRGDGAAELSRSLGDMALSAPSVQATLYGDTDWSACPFNTGAAANGVVRNAGNVADQSEDPVEQATRSITMPDEDEYLEDLLTWFKAAADTSEAAPANKDRCKLVLPASLSKERRKVWHGAAQRIGLQSLSTGTGDKRHLQISLRGSLGPKQDVSVEAKRLWALAQDAGGSMQQLSLREIQSMLDTRSLTPELRQLLKHSEQAAAICDALGRGDGETALRLVESDANLLWVRNAGDEYPLHRACEKGLEDVVSRMVQLQPGIIQQRSREYKTAMAMDVEDAESRSRLIQALKVHQAPPSDDEQKGT